MGLHIGKHARANYYNFPFPRIGTQLFLFTLFPMTITAEPDINDHTDLLTTLLRVYLSLFLIA